VAVAPFGTENEQDAVLQTVMPAGVVTRTEPESELPIPGAGGGF
jgi:hypothetical protein